MRKEIKELLYETLCEARDSIDKQKHYGLYQKLSNLIPTISAYRSSVTMNEYQLMASATAVYPGRGTFLGLMYVTGKMAGEAGEFSENTFKALRDDDIANVIEHTPPTIAVCFGELKPERKAKSKKELGDILWYVSQSAFELGYSLDEIAFDNIEKLRSRKERDVLHGSGSDR